MHDHRFAYFHGFASSALSTKGVRMSETLARSGVSLECPDLNRPSFAKLTYTSMLEAAQALTEGSTWRLIGSSMGGYLAARLAAAHPERVDKLVLLCPAFYMHERWPKLFGEDFMQSWRERGFAMLPDGAGTPQPVHWGLVEDGARHPSAPMVTCPTLIIHGRSDETVPIEVSRRYAEANAHVTLLEVDGDHRLLDAMPQIEAAVIAFFELPEGG